MNRQLTGRNVPVIAPGDWRVAPSTAEGPAFSVVRQMAVPEVR